MDDPPAQADGKDIKPDSGGGADQQRYLVEEYLGHRVEGRDVKHIGLSMGNDINNRSNCEKHCQQWQCFCVFVPAFSRKIAPPTVKTDEDQDQMPGKSVDCQRHIRLHEPRRLCQRHDASKEGKILEIGTDGAGDGIIFMHKN